MLPYPLIAIPAIYRHGFWLGTSHALAVCRLQRFCIIAKYCIHRQFFVRYCLCRMNS